MPRAELVESEFREGNEVFVLGFPLGLAGESRNYTIVRQGIVARIHDWYDDEAKVFLVDASIFPGNSGGPVLAKPTMHTYGKAITTATLIGMVSCVCAVRGHCEERSNRPSNPRHAGELRIGDCRPHRRD